MGIRNGLVGLLGLVLINTGSFDCLAEEKIRESADKLYREVEKKGRGVYLNVGEVHYSAFSTSSNMLVHSIVLNGGNGFEKLANYDFEEGKLDFAEVVIYDKKRGKSVLEKGVREIVGGLFHKMMELLNQKKD